MTSLILRSIGIAGLLLGAPGHARTQEPRGVFLADLTWPEAERVLTRDRLVVIPLGAASKEHGPHLRLDNDFRMAEYLARRVAERADVVIAPTIAYSFYPSFVEYPGSTSLRLEVARDLVVDVVRSLSAYGPRRFYVLNTGVSTRRPLEEAAAELRKEGIELRFTNILTVTGEAESRIRQEPAGTHADEIETSMMLYIAPDRVDMTRATREIPERTEGPLTRSEGKPGLYSPSGVFGDATLATVEKGRVVVEALVAGVLREIEEAAGAPLPGAAR